MPLRRYNPRKTAIFGRFCPVTPGRRVTAPDRAKPAENLDCNGVTAPRPPSGEMMRCSHRAAPATSSGPEARAAARLLPAQLAGCVLDPIEAAERAALAGGGGVGRTYQPGDPDPLRDGLLRGWRDHRRDTSPGKT